MSKEIKNMDFKELRNEVQRLRDELAIMQRKYEDILYNLDNENFSEQIIKEKNGMKTQIEINENAISTKVSTEDFESEKIQTAQQIASKVSSDEMWTAINQTSGEITTEASKAICEWNDTLYYWNSIYGEWAPARYTDVVKSKFLQTADGFILEGDVSVRGKIISTDEGSYGRMSNTGFNLFIYNNEQKRFENKIGMGYKAGLYNYPYITMGAGTTGYGTDTSCIYKLGSGLWIGDSSIIPYGGEFPGGEYSVEDISSICPHGTGVFIDLINEEVHKYEGGVPTQFGGGEATFG